MAFMGNIQAIHQVKVAEDRDLLHFLLWPNGGVTQNLVEYRITVHLFGASVFSKLCKVHAEEKH